jgi:hypothetical protein
MSVDIESSHLLLPLPVYEAAYGSNSLWVMAGAHRVSASCAQDGPVLVARQSKLESVKEKNIFALCAAANGIPLADQLLLRLACFGS